MSQGFSSQTGQVGFKTQVSKGSYVSPGASAVNEVQRLTSTATGGTFTVSFGGHTTTAIAWNATAAAIQLALTAISTIGEGNVLCAGGPLNSGFVSITFQGALAGTNVAQVTVDNTSASGGTVVPSTTTPGVPGTGVFMRTTGGALGIKRELLIPDPEIGGNRDVSDAVLGAAAYAGQYTFYGRLESLATLIYAALGGKSSAVAGAGTSAQVGTHTITPANALPWLSIEEAVSTFDVFNYTDAKVSALHLESDANGYLKGTCDLIALTQSAGNTATVAPAWDTSPLLVGSNVVFKFDGVDMKATKWSFDVKNNIEDNDFRLGSLSLGDAVEKRREVMAQITIRPEDHVVWREAAYGAASATSPQGGAAYKGAVDILVTSYVVIGTSAVVWTLHIAAPTAVVKPWDAKPEGDKVMEGQLDIQFVRPDPAVDLLSVIVKNDLAVVA